MPRRVTLPLAAMNTLPLAAATLTQAQCSTWQPDPLSNSAGGIASFLKVWDIDGPGPGLPGLVMSGRSNDGSSDMRQFVRFFDGSRWRNLGAPISEGLRYVSYIDATLWDPDGPGPAGNNLAALIYNQEADSRGRPLYYWRLAICDGQTWTFGGDFRPGIARRIAVWDADGDGPDLPGLVIGGEFTLDTPSGVALNFAMWRDGRWYPLGSGLRSGSSYSPAALIPFDFGGTIGRTLVAGGRFIDPDESSFVNVVMWNGTSWSVMPTGGAVDYLGPDGLASWDSDGDGPAPASLIVANRSVGAGNHLFRWTGDSWTPFGPVSYAAQVIGDFDPDGPGPAAPGLLAKIFPENYNAADLISLDGEAVATRLASFSDSATNVVAEILAASWDPDGPDGEPPRLVITPPAPSIQDPTGATRRMPGPLWAHPDPQTTSWHLLGRGLDSTVRALCLWDRDGEGPMSPGLIAAGYFERAGDQLLNRVGSWNGTEFVPLGGGVPLPVLFAAAWDRDGPGGEPEVLVVSQTDPNAPTGPCTFTIWNGSVWSDLAAPPLTYVSAIAVYDPDESGPLPASLFVAKKGGYQQEGVLTLNSGQWTYVNGTNGIGPISQPQALSLWDADGAGPALPVLVVCGTARQSPARSPCVAAWDGANWTQLPFASSGPVMSTATAMGSWDPDGVGPRPPRLIVGGTAVQVLSYADGAWSELRTPDPQFASLPVRALASYDFDPRDSIGPELCLALGDSSTLGLAGLMRWNGTDWQIAGDLVRNIGAMLSWDPDGAGNAPPELAFGLRSGRDFFMRWIGIPERVRIIAPADRLALYRSTIQLFAAGEGDGGIRYRWRLNGNSISTEYTPQGTYFSGRGSQVLTLNNLTPDASGLYSVIATDSCGETESEPFLLTVICRADQNADGGIDGSDLAPFFERWEQADAAADLNQDGGVDGADVEMFVNLWTSGQC